MLIKILCVPLPTFSFMVNHLWTLIPGLALSESGYPTFLPLRLLLPAYLECSAVTASLARSSSRPDPSPTQTRESVLEGFI